MTWLKSGTDSDFDHDVISGKETNEETACLLLCCKPCSRCAVHHLFLDAMKHAAPCTKVRGASLLPDTSHATAIGHIKATCNTQIAYKRDSIFSSWSSSP